MAFLRRLGSLAAAGLLWLAHFLPTPLLGEIGAGLGALFYRFGRGRVTDLNLALCFPHMPPEERTALAKRHFRALGRAAIHLAILWFGSDKRVLGMVTMTGREHIEANRGRPIILLAPHFIGLNLGGARVAENSPGAGSIYSRQKNPVLDRLLLKGRLRFGHPTLLARQDGMLPIVRFLRQDKVFYFLPDMDFGARDAMFVDFFGVKAATITALPRLAKVTGAAVIPAVTRQVGDRYVVEVHPPFDNYPSGDLEADVRRMNAFVEACALTMPEQYFWVHKRFKTRPPGEKNPYRGP